MIYLVPEAHADLAAGALVEKRSMSDVVEGLVVEWAAANRDKISKAREAIGTMSPAAPRRRPTKRKAA